MSGGPFGQDLHLEDIPDRIEEEKKEFPDRCTPVSDILETVVGDSKRLFSLVKAIDYYLEYDIEEEELREAFEKYGGKDPDQEKPLKMGPMEPNGPGYWFYETEEFAAGYENNPWAIRIEDEFGHPERMEFIEKRLAIARWLGRAVPEIPDLKCEDCRYMEVGSLDAPCLECRKEGFKGGWEPKERVVIEGSNGGVR